ncbi:MAG: hypothetical protein ACK5TR_05370 [Alphaproteobacteria bacterium]|jgi:hypothetical protein|nr:hypothetical protein [Alphaproteobacteria bacterium]
MKKRFIWFWAAFNIPLSMTPLWAQNQVRCPILFALYDVADVNALKVVADTLATHNKKVCFFALGQANTQLKDDARVVLHEVALGGAQTWPREKLLSPHMLKRLQDELRPQVVVTGMASAAQNQMLSLAYKKSFSFYDNFDPIKDKEYVQAFFIQSQSSGVKPFSFWVASDKTAQSFRTEPRAHGVSVDVVGQPVLEEWSTLFEETDRAALKRTLKIPDKRQVILFAGGYDESYERHFRLFLEAVIPLIDPLNLEILITYHPKTNGDLEKKVVSRLDLPHVRVMDTPPMGPSTIKLATLASIFMCHKSSLGPQAISQNLPMIYVADPRTYKNFVIEQNLASISNDKMKIRRHIKEQLLCKKMVSLNTLGMPKDPASQIMARKILRALED